MLAVIFLLAALAILGHAALWIGFVNRVHSTGAPRWLVKALSATGYALLTLTPIAAAGIWWNSGRPLGDWLRSAAEIRGLWFYLIPCWIIAIAVLLLWLKRHWLTKPPVAVRENHTSIVDVVQTLGRKPLAGLRAHVFSHVPGNQVLKLAIQERHCEIARLPAALDGLSIAHLSDLHFTGRIGIDFFHEVIRQTNALQADMIALTGDIIDEIDLLDWIPEVFSKLSAPLGLYFVLGNHDQFTRQTRRIRQALAEAGFIETGVHWRKIVVAGADIIIAGNELPWFAPAADMEHCPPRSAGEPQLRILLSHSPDQFAWARRLDFDLMLAGHTHGGQICLPLVGPILAPSWYGVKYAGGSFYAEPTLMHVSRGVSGELPIRLNCPPELTKLVLRCPPNNPAD